MYSTLTIRIPAWLDFICVCPLLLYRRLKYGCVFRRIYLGEGEWTILDLMDYYRLSRYKWVIHQNGKYFSAVRYVKIAPRQIIPVSLHREIMPPPPGLVVDHKNRNALDNRSANLRPATKSQNAMNCRRDKSKNSSRFIGVHKGTDGKWQVRIRYRGIRKYLGTYVDEIQAAKVYDKAAKKYHGEFAQLNFDQKPVLHILKKPG